MSSEPYLDPLEAGYDLLKFIIDDDKASLSLTSLARKIDALVYAIRFCFQDNIAPIEGIDEDSPREDFRKDLRQKIATRFPNRGFYWQALGSNMDDNREGEVGVGDFIDDLEDIAVELMDVKWIAEKYDQTQAIAALRWRYSNHINLHLLHLRVHIEELTEYEL